MPNWSVPIPADPLQLFFYLATSLVTVCVVAIFTAVFINFALAKSGGTVARERKSPVATGTMIGFFLGYYALIHYRIGVVHLHTVTLVVVLVSLGLLLMLTGAIVNILGRVHLGRNWANQATLYAEHTLVTGGIFGLVRHPLYASLIWMYFGAALIYQNYAALLANLLIFLPAMYYRGKLEEALLAQRFPEYRSYQRRVGMFFPTFAGGRHDSL